MKNKNILYLLLILGIFIAGSAFAQTQAVPGVLPPPTAGEVISKMIPMFIMVFFVFYFLVFRPQQAKLKTQSELLSSLKKGESVVSESGIVGKVVNVEENFVTLEIAKEVKVKFTKQSIVKREGATV
jgi:preprotein translocase subunit YajC